VESMRQDAEIHADDDRRRKEIIEARNEADNLTYAAEKAIKEHAERIPADIKMDIEGKLADVRARSLADDAAAIIAASRDLGAAIQKIGAVANDQAGNPPVASDRPVTPDAGPNVVEGELKD